MFCGRAHAARSRAAPTQDLGAHSCGLRAWTAVSRVVEDGDEDHAACTIGCAEALRDVLYVRHQPDCASVLACTAYGSVHAHALRACEDCR